MKFKFAPQVREVLSCNSWRTKSRVGKQNISVPLSIEEHPQNN